MDAIFDAYAGQVAPVRVHVGWPNPNDPFWLYNTSELQTRRNYYGVNSVPAFRFDGLYLKNPSDFGTYAQWYAWVWNTLDSLVAVPSDVRIDMEQARDYDSIYVSFDVVAGGSTSGNFRIYLVATDMVDSVGYFDYWHIARDFVPNGGGWPVTLAPHDSLHFEWAFPEVPNAEDLITNIFVQNSSTRQIVQGASAPIPEDPTSVAAGDAPLRFALAPNTPNPFNPQTTIGFSVDRDRHVRLSVYDVTGRLVRELLDKTLGAGSHTVVWDGMDSSGREVASGIYLYRLEGDRASFARKMILVR